MFVLLNSTKIEKWKWTKEKLKHKKIVSSKVSLYTLTVRFFISVSVLDSMKSWVVGYLVCCDMRSMTQDDDSRASASWSQHSSIVSQIALRPCKKVQMFWFDSKRLVYRGNAWQNLERFVCEFDWPDCQVASVWLRINCFADKFYVFHLPTHRQYTTRKYLQNENANVLVYVDASSLLQHSPAFPQLTDEFQAKVQMKRKNCFSMKIVQLVRQTAIEFTSVSNGKV